MTTMKSIAPPPSALPSGAQQACDLKSCVLKSHRASTLPAGALLNEFAASLGQDRGTTVDLLIQMGAIEARKLYVPLACATMYDYCTEVLHMCEGTASRRIRAARAARQFPVILPMLAEGKLHLSAVSLLAPHLKPANVASLLAEATHKSKADVERLVARRFPKRDVATLVRPLADSGFDASPIAQVVANIAAQLSPVTSVPTNSEEVVLPVGPLSMSSESRAVHQVVSQLVVAAAGRSAAPSVPEVLLASIADAVTQTIVSAAAPVAPGAPSQAELPARVSPRSAGRYTWQLTADQQMQDLLEEAQDLIGHAGARDLARVLKRGLEVLVETLRKVKYAEASHAREQSVSTNGRHVPHAVVRAVSERDGRQCTFAGPDGRRCTERSDLQFDHVIPFARGGQTTVENLRLLCRTHNQYEAERVYGAEHMREQQAASRGRAERAKTARAESSVRLIGGSTPEQRPACGRDTGGHSQGDP